MPDEGGYDSPSQELSRLFTVDHMNLLTAFQKSAAKLGVDQIDLLILHQALPSDFDETLETAITLECFGREIPEA